MKLIAALVIVWISAAPALAHLGDRVFSIPYLSADDLAYIELDGDVTDWKDLFVEPTLTALDFTMYHHQALTFYSEYDPANLNLDFRLWMGWADGGKIYVAAEAADDVYKLRETDTGIHYFNDHIALMVDGDHSGGPFIFLGRSSSDPPVRTRGIMPKRNTMRPHLTRNRITGWWPSRSPWPVGGWLPSLSLWAAAPY